MKKGKDHWQGGLQYQFDRDEAFVPEEAWEIIEKNIKPKNSRKKTIFFFFSILVLGSTFMVFSLSPKQSNIGNSVPTKNKKKEIAKRIETNENHLTSDVKRSIQTIDKHPKFSVRKQTGINSNKKTALYNAKDSNSINQPIEKNQNEKDLKSTTSIHMIDSSKRNLNLTLLKPSILLIELGQLIHFKKHKLNTYELTIFGGFGYNKRIVKGDFNTDNKKSRDLGESAFNAESKQFGLNFEKKITTHLSIGTGMMWSQSNYSSNWFFRQLYLQPNENSLFLNSPEGKLLINDSGFLDYFSSGDTLLYKLKASFRTNAISIPFYFTVEHKIGRITPFAKGGFSLEMQNKATSTVQTFQYGQLKDLSNQLDRRKIESALGGIVSFGFKFGLTKNLSLNLEERFNFALTPLVKYNGITLKTNCFYTNFGVSYTITQPKNRK